MYDFLCAFFAIEKHILEKPIGGLLSEGLS
jgi:hypothetical protein